MTNIVRAKFRVSGRSADSGPAQVYLSAVVEGEENKHWAHATPAGAITMVIGNPLAAALFEPGRELFVDFSEV